MLRKMLFREIKQSLGRFLAIMAIIALGVGFFAGLSVTRDAMLKTGGEYLDENKFFDFRLLSTLGLTEDDVAAFSAADGVAYAEGGVSADVLMRADGEDSDGVVKVMTLPEELNTPTVIAGRLPLHPSECVADPMLCGEDAIGSWVSVSSDNSEQVLDTMRYGRYQIVGLVSSPLYMNYERGSTALGTGVVAGYIYVPQDGVRSEVFTEVYVRLAERAELYSDEYADLADRFEPELEKLLDERADIRYEDIRTEAQGKIDDGADEVADAEKELADAKKELDDGEDEYAKGLAQYNSGSAQLEDAKRECAELEATLAEAQPALESGRAELEQSEAQLAGAKAQLDEGAAALDAAQAQLDAQAAALAALPAEHPAKQALAAAQAQIDAGRAELAAQESELTKAAALLEAGKAEFAAKEAEYQQGVAGVEQYKSGIESTTKALAAAWHKLEDARQELDDGWEEYSDGAAELADARKELDDAQRELDDLKYADCYVLGRNTNIGYVCFESDTGIVDGVADVFPLFFFLVAALVCITTMTRMVDEQRTQIGTLKALGYGDGAIMGNYLSYAMSASVIGCVAGFAGGSYIFPKVLWLVYDIMYDFYRPIRYVIDWRLAAVSIVMYLFCTALATWLACKNELREVAAQLIRPKAPKPGKRILLERVTPLWSRMKFLHKVSARNVFRYKKRMVMMILGIGGCMALLLTGLGINDSIQNIVDDQFDEISVYDMSVNFRDGMDADEAERFTASASDVIDSVIFLHESSTEVSGEDATKTANFVVFTEPPKDYILLHGEDGAPVDYPGDGEAVINTSLAANLGAAVGDTVTLYDENNRAMRLTVSGLYENYIYNYIFTTSASCREAWGHEPEVQTAYVNVRDGLDLHAAAARLMDDDATASVSVNQDMRDRVGSIMGNLDYIVLLVIVSAGALAFIVLYNLTNINLGERVREIATLKVLGFYQPETASYVLRENIILTLMGALAGIPLGIALHRYVMAQINIDMITFHVRISPTSYVLSFVMCFVYTIVVNFFMKAHIRRINMAESLKAAE